MRIRDSCIDSELEVGNEFPILIKGPKSVDEAVVRHLRHQLVAEFIGKLAKKTFPLSFQ